MILRPRYPLALLAGVTLAASLLGASPAGAADGDLSWGVQPSTPEGPDGRSELSYQVAPGAVVRDWVAVTNSSPTAATFRVYAADAVTDYDTAAFTLINADEASTGAGGWTSIDGSDAVCADTDDEAERACAKALGATITLEPGTRADIPFTLTVPHDATPGDHAAGIVASSVSTAAAEGSSVTVEQRVGTRIYLRVGGALSPGIGVQGTVAGYDGGLNPFGGTTRAGFDVSNLGNTRISVQPHVRVTGPFGIGLGSVSLPVVQNLVPGGVAHVEADVPGVAPLFLLSADVTLTPVPAAGVAAADPLPAAVVSSTVMWAVPWMLLAALLLIVAVVVSTVWWRRRSRQLLAEELTAYADRIREEERVASAVSDPSRGSRRVASPDTSFPLPESETVR